jgi:hypothetical protein
MRAPLVSNEPRKTTLRAFCAMSMNPPGPTVNLPNHPLVSEAVHAARFPIADSLDDARTCVDQIERAGVVAAMGFNRRLDAVHRDLHSRLATGDIGTIEMLRLVLRGATPPP